ncbi:MAG: hypothetical protein ABL892_12110 [Thiobacillaceae bacterium]
MNIFFFHTPAEYQTALDQLIAAAKHHIRIHDRNLDTGGFNSSERYDSLRKFCLTGTGQRIEILLDDPAYLQNQCPRLMTLLRDFSHVIEIRQTEAGSERPEFGFALADRSAVLKRFDKDASQGQLDLDDAAGAVLLHQQFDQLWQRAPASVSATTLGLG